MGQSRGESAKSRRGPRSQDEERQEHVPLLRTNVVHT